MTDRLEIVRICDRNVHGNKALRRRRVSLTAGKRRGCVLDAQGCHPVKTQKTHPRTTCAYLAVSKKVVAIVRPLRTTKSEQPDINKSSVS